MYVNQDESKSKIMIEDKHGSISERKIDESRNLNCDNITDDEELENR